MTVMRALSGSRRSVAAVLVASAVTAGLAGADLVSGAGRAEAQVNRAARQATTTATVSVGTGSGTEVGTGAAVGAATALGLPVRSTVASALGSRLGTPLGSTLSSPLDSSLATTVVSSLGTTLGSTLGTAPVSVPADVRFELDLVPVAVTSDPRPVHPSGVREVAAVTLARLPASAGVALRFDDPRLGRHLGGVFMNAPDAILVGASRLGGDLDKTADVVRHEIAHIYQARLMTTLGYDTVDDRMVRVFGPNGLERAADCVALALGATWTHYTSDCAGPEKAAAVEALIEGRMP